MLFKVIPGLELLQSCFKGVGLGGVDFVTSSTRFVGYSSAGLAFFFPALHCLPL